MIKFLKWVFGLFSSYVNSFERRVNRFFSHIKSTSNIADIREDLLKLMQENLIVVNIWLEKKFKGYKYLTKKSRRKMYEDTEKIKQKFQAHCSTCGINQEAVRGMLDQMAITYPNGDDGKILYLAQIMDFLRPGKYYRYIKTSSFGKLLRDPDQEKLEGDCNQIVTLYIYLYSLKFPVNDLKIKLLTGHVCLQFREIDIEATNGYFAKYREFDHILPVTEIISTNLLDLADFREEIVSISPRELVKSSELAFAISSLRTLVEKNLAISFRNMAIFLLKSYDFSGAEFFAQKTGDEKLINGVYREAVSYYANKQNFSKALYYAQKSGDSGALQMVRHNEAAYEFNKLAKKVAGVRTLTDAKNNRSTYQKMLSLAERMEDKEIENSVRDTLSQIS